jgi:5'-3' exonuclease
MEWVVDYMALVGDTVDNHPGAKGWREGRRGLIQKCGSVENALIMPMKCRTSDSGSAATSGNK